MPMRASDATWLERDVVPLLESLQATLHPGCTLDGKMVGNLSGSSVALLTRLAETTSAIKRRLEGRQKPATAEIHRMSRNPAVEHYSADVDGQKVPYIDISRWPCVWTESGCAEQVYPCITFFEHESDGSSHSTPKFSYEPKVHWDGDWCWTVSIDGRFDYDFECREDVELVLPILAQGMAVAAGFTSHGPHSFPKNHHGPAVGLAPFTELPTAELTQSEGWGLDAIADAVVKRLRDKVVLDPMM